jgi:FlaA1/EpsC-like NDP-sugar epimerase
MKKQLICLKILQIVVDGILILSAFALAYFLRIGFFFSTDFPFSKYILIAAITMPVTLLFMFFIRAYKLNQQIVSLRHIQRLTFVALENVFVFMILYYFTFRAFFSRLILVYVFILTLILTYLWHILFRWILQKASEREIGVYRTLVIGTNRPAQEIIHILITSKSHIKPVAVIDAHGSGKTMIHGIPVVGKMNLFEKTIADHNIDAILQTDNLEQSLNIINYALANNLKYFMPPELLGIFQGHQMIEEIEGMPFLKVHKDKKWWNSIW